MSATAIKFDERRKKFTATVNGKLVKSSNRRYVEAKIVAAGGTVKSEQETAKAVKSKFTVTERFAFLQQITCMVAADVVNAAIICGDGGLGKSHTVHKTLTSAGLTNLTGMDTNANGIDSFAVVKGFSSAKGLYRKLYENSGPGSVLVFDDCDSVLKDKDAIPVLKGALDTNEDRWISWSADLRDPDLPRSFKYEGRCIFINNMPLANIDEALRTRAICVDLSMTPDEKIERMLMIINEGEFLPNVSHTQKMDALELIKKHKDECSDLSLRTLGKICKIRKTGGNWQKFGEYVLTQ